MLRAEEYDGTFSQQTKIVKFTTCIAPSSFLFLHLYKFDNNWVIMCFCNTHTHFNSIFFLVAVVDLFMLILFSFSSCINSNFLF